MPRLGALAAVLLLTGCVAVEDGGGPMKPRPDKPQMCPMIYAPVCGERGGSRRTFGNSCQANAEGFRIVRRGECSGRPGSGGWNGGGGPGPVRPPRPGRPERPERPEFCTREYAPVCARRGSSVRTFSNSCEAERGGYSIVGRGACR
ncbi:protease inhibitor [Phyllobacterium phragmitis]|uniref:Protease inhibitor n=2 Tax=Phyllobacterium phragmitis TaxID=2670329 RepID=A0A2S9IY05_9HYPH|nr:protease inhibitor [Phyllobacterium phragmitis]